MMKKIKEIPVVNINKLIKIFRGTKKCADSEG